MKKMFLDATLMIVFCGLAASAQVTEQVGYEFCSINGCLDGGTPTAPLISDGHGNLYGTTQSFGAGLPSAGTVFELSPDGKGAWTETVLYSFCSVTDCIDGNEPLAGLVFDKAGKLYGTTVYGGTYENGTVFELSPGRDGSWTEQVLHSFSLTNQDGNYPHQGLILDAHGNLYGTCQVGGAFLYGTVFELSPGSDGEWTETILYNFGQLPDGEYPSSGVQMDATGRLYGVTGYGGAYNYGTVFALAHTAKGWEEKILHSFNPNTQDGIYPNGDLILDAAGSLFGTTPLGGASGYGTVFEVTPQAVGNSPEVVLHSFNKTTTDGTNPEAGLIFDSQGNLYGTTVYGVVGSNCNGYGCGTVFRLKPNNHGGWTESVLYTFKSNGVDGQFPYAGLMFDGNMGLVGTTAFGGSGAHGLGGGTMFEIKP